MDDGQMQTPSTKSIKKHPQSPLININSPSSSNNNNNNRGFNTRNTGSLKLTTNSIAQLKNVEESQEQQQINTSNKPKGSPHAFKTITPVGSSVNLAALERNAAAALEHQNQIRNITNLSQPSVVSHSNDPNTSTSLIMHAGTTTAPSMSNTMNNIQSMAGGPGGSRLSSVSSSANGLNSSHNSSNTGPDPLTKLAARYNGSKRNGLLKWVQERTNGYKHVEITNFSSSWSDGLALCALLHTYIPNAVPWKKLSPANRRQNLHTAINAANSYNIYLEMSVDEILGSDRPEWEKVMKDVASIYKFFET